MDESKKGKLQDQRLTRILDRLAEMERLVEQLPEPERDEGRAAVARIRRAVQPVIDALMVRH